MTIAVIILEGTYKQIINEVKLNLANGFEIKSHTTVRNLEGAWHTFILTKPERKLTLTNAISDLATALEDTGDIGLSSDGREALFDLGMAVREAMTHIKEHQTITPK